MDPFYDSRSAGGALPPELDPRGSRRHRRSGSSGSGMLLTGSAVLKVFSALLSLALVVYIGYLWNTVRGLNDVPKVTVSGLGGVLVDPRTGKVLIDPKTGQAMRTTKIDGTDQNLLIFGNDDRSGLTDAQVRELHVGRDGGSLNTDSMMIAHLPSNGSKATILSLPRDSYVNIPGFGMNKLNAAYGMAYDASSGSKLAKQAAGTNELVETVQSLTGLNIDHTVQVSLIGFVNISDAVGGVTVNLCKAVNDTVAANEARGWSGGSGLVLRKGKTPISGAQALAFVRQREGFALGDIQRTARQRYFLTAAFRKVASAGTLLNLGRLQNLVSAVQKSIVVDSGLNLLDLAKQMSRLQPGNIVGAVYPYSFGKDPNGSDIDVVSPAAIKTFVAGIVGKETSTYPSAPTVRPSTVSVSVLNLGNTNGAATTAATTLDRAGFKAGVDSAATGGQSVTTISYPKGMESQAKTLAKYVPGAQVVQTTTKTITLTLGTDGLGAKSKPTSVKHVKHKKAVDSGCIK